MTQFKEAVEICTTVLVSKRVVYTRKKYSVVKTGKKCKFFDVFYASFFQQMNKSTVEQIVNCINEEFKLRNISQLADWQVSPCPGRYGEIWIYSIVIVSV
jgi:hypothetical protein